MGDHDWEFGSVKIIWRDAEAGEMGSVPLRVLILWRTLWLLSLYPNIVNE